MMNRDKKILSATAPVLRKSNKGSYVSTTVTYVGGAKNRLKFYEGLKHAKDEADLVQRSNVLINRVNRIIAQWLHGTPEVKRKATVIQNALYVAYNRLKVDWKQKTREAYRTRIWQFAAWCDANNISKVPHITPEVAHNYIHQLKENMLAPSTINNTIVILNNLLNYYNCYAFENIPLHKRYSISDKYFTPDQIPVLKQAIIDKEPQLWLAVQLLYYCFIRPGEQRFLRIGDINFFNKTITVPGTISKNKKTQTVAIPDALFPDLLYLKYFPAHFYVIGKEGSPSTVTVSKDRLYRLHQAVLKSLDYPQGYTFYSWKHTGAVMFCQATKDIKALQLQMRHHSLDMTNEYLKNLGIMDFESLRTGFPAI